MIFIIISIYSKNNFNYLVIHYKLSLYDLQITYEQEHWFHGKIQ